MAVRTLKPTSAGRRFQTILAFDEITKVGPEKSLVVTKKRSGGRNSLGRITTRHIGGGHKRKIRLIDFRREKFGVPAKVAAIEYDPNRSARIALLHYRDGEKRYILAPHGLKVDDTVVSGPTADILPSWIEKRRVLEVEWGADVDHFTPQATGTLPFTRDPNRITCVFAGAFRSWHGVVHLAAALARLHAGGDHRFVAVLIGVFQAIAILPGVSRSGTTISVGLMSHLRRDIATTFSFLIAVPAVAGAVLLTAKDMIETDAKVESYGALAVGIAVSFIVGCLALSWLLRIVKHFSFIFLVCQRDIQSLVPFRHGARTALGTTAGPAQVARGTCQAAELVIGADRPPVSIVRSLSP